jgi:hypothetical protein
MYFQGRELKPYAEPITPERLVVGEMYFSVQYEDQDMLAPVVEPLVFLGDLEPEPDGLGHYFQDAGSYLAGLRYTDADQQYARFLRQAPGQVSHIFEFEHAMDELLKCSLRRAERADIRFRPAGLNGRAAQQGIGADERRHG